MAISNLLAMPLAQVAITTGTNEDWVGSFKFLVDTGVPEAEMPQLDLRGIEFEMEVRRDAPEHEVLITGTTADGTLMIGEPPDFGYLLINIPIETMEVQQPGTYVADIIGRDDEAQRVVAQIGLTIIQGITR